jgi:hypothetical protein
MSTTLSLVKFDELENAEDLTPSDSCLLSAFRLCISNLSLQKDFVEIVYFAKETGNIPVICYRTKDNFTHKTKFCDGVWTIEKSVPKF